MDKPTLDAAALDRIESGELGVGPTTGEKLIAQARLALAQAERIATLTEQQERHVREIDLLGARIATLEAETAAQSWDVLLANAHAATLRNALEKADAAFNAWGRDEDGIHPDAWPAVEHLRAVLAATPAASLAAHRKSVLEKAAIICESRDCRGCADNIRNPYPHGIPRALAAQEVR